MPRTWRPAKCLTVLRDEINAAWPNRNRAQDGIIGNAEHAARTSDHNPDSRGVVHAIDIDARGIPAQAVVDRLHALAVAGDKRMVGGYLIWNRRIASHTHAWVWRAYTGADPHNLHFHMSCTYEAACDSTAPWGVVPTTTEEPDMPLTAEDKQWIKQTVKDEVYGIVTAQLDAQVPKIVRDNAGGGADTGNAAATKWTIEVKPA